MITGEQVASVTPFEDQELKIEPDAEKSFSEATAPEGNNRKKIKFPHVKGKRSQFNDQLVKSATNKALAAQEYIGDQENQD